MPLDNNFLPFNFFSVKEGLQIFDLQKDLQMVQSCCQCNHESNLPLDFLYCSGVNCELCLCKFCNTNKLNIWHCSVKCSENSNALQSNKSKKSRKRTKSVAPPDELQRKAAAYDQITATYKKVEEMRPQLQLMRRKLEDARKQMHECIK
jgi:hypothetical protein